MAEAPSKRLYGLFAPKPRPAPPAQAAPPPPPPPPPPSTADLAAPLPALALPPMPAKPLPAAKLTRTPSAVSSRARTPTPSESITLSTDDEDTDGSATLAGSSSGKRKAKKPSAPKKGKGKTAKTVVLESADEEDELIIVESSAGTSKGKKLVGKGKGKVKGTTTPKKKTKKPSSLAPSAGSSTVLDLTTSPIRASGSGFASLSETYKKEREARKANEGIEARWPTREEHGEQVATRSTPSDARVWAEGLPRRMASSTDVKGKGRALDDGEEDFLSSYARQQHLFPSFSVNSASPTFDTRPLADIRFHLPSYTSHPLLNRFAHDLTAQLPTPKSSSPSEDKLWTTKYGPKTAAEVLGTTSGTSALQLREWLEELKVQDGDDSPSKKRRHVARGVDKKKKKKAKGPLGDFLASDDEDDNLPPASDPLFDTPDDYSDPEDFPACRPATSVFPTLTNLILLHGPHGSGKTSSVHAIAHELGYEVFEVYPGIGKRRAHDLERYVGDVGKNHLVRASPRKGGGGDLFSMFAKQGAGPSKDVKGKGKEKEVEKVEATLKVKGPMQSLILVDEVDVLYSQEHDFWDGVIALAKESRRPIVMTCSDLGFLSSMRSLSQDPTEADKSLIPFDKLGLQKVLYPGSDSTVNYLDFAPPEPELAVPFLSLVALNEGFVLPASTVSDLYTTFSTSRPNPPYLLQPENGERPLPHPRSRAPLASRDLRKAVMQLQSELQWLGKEDREGETGRRWQVGGLRVLEREKAGDEEAEVLVAATEGDIGERTVTDDVEALKRAAIAAEALSASDALIERRTRVRLEDDDGGRFTTASDAEITLPILEQLSDDDERLQLPSIGAEPAMAHAILSLSAKIWGDALRFGDVEDEMLEEKRSTFAVNLSLLTQPTLGVPIVSPEWNAPLLPHPVSTTLYRPFLRLITLADDAREAALGVVPRQRQGSAELDGGGGGGGGVGQKTRRSTRRNKEPVYERQLPWQSQVEADWLRGSGFPREEEEAGGGRNGESQEEVEERARKVKRVVEDDEE